MSYNQITGNEVNKNYIYMCVYIAIQIKTTKSPPREKKKKKKGSVPRSTNDQDRPKNMQQSSCTTKQPDTLVTNKKNSTQSKQHKDTVNQLYQLETTQII